MARQERYTTPVGKLVYPHLTKARDFQGNGKFAYDTQFLIEDAAAARDFAGFVAEQLEASKTKHGKPAAPAPYAFNEEGGLVVRFKVNAITETKNGSWDRKPALFHRNGEPVEDGFMVGGGSVGQLSFTVYHWKTPSQCGVTLQPVAGIFDLLVEYQKGGSASDFGFETRGERPSPTADDEETSTPPEAAPTGARGEDF